MVAKTWYMTNSLAGTAHQEMSETDPGTEATASPQTGWVVSTGATNHASMDAQSNVAAASFTATTQPDGTPVTTAGGGDCLRTTNPYTGNFASGNWTFSFCFRGVTQAGTQDGRVRFRLLRGKDPTGSDAVDISGSQQQASLVTNLLTTPTQTSSLVVNPGAFEVSNQYIFVQVAWERTGAGGMTTTDVAFRIGNASGAGTRVQSADFTPTAPRTDPPDKTGVLFQPPAYLRAFGAGVVSLQLLASAGPSLLPAPPPEPPVEEVPPFYAAAITTTAPMRRTLFYQARIEPVPLEIVPIEADTFPVVTSTPRTKTLHYQASIKPPLQAAEVVVEVTPAQWMVPLSRAAPRPPVKVTLTTPFVPQLTPPVTADEWLQPWRRQVAGPFPFHTQPVLAYAVAPQVTPDEWLQPFQKAVPTPPVRHTQPVSGYQPEEVVAPTTTLEWLLPFNRTAPAYKPVVTQPFYGYPYEAAVVVNTETIDKWQQPLSKAVPRPPVFSGLYTPFVPREATLENTPSGTGWELTVDGHGAFPRRPVAPQGGQPFVPREATLENTVATGWHQPFYKAVPPLRLNVSQPVYGYPYEAVDNTRNEWDWHVQWPGPPRRLLGLASGQPFVAKQFVQDVHGPDKWLQAFRSPPRYWPLKVQAIPFVPREATVDNTVPTGWHQPLYKAVPAPKPVPTQPVFGYPYETQAIVVPYEQWWSQPLSRAALRPAVHNRPYQPFVPREATLENTVTVEKWLTRWQGPPAYRPLKPTQPSFVYAPAAVVTLTTTLEWQPPLSVAVAARKAQPTQPVYAPVEPAAAAEAGYAASITSGVIYRKTLFYQAKVQPYYPYEQADVCIPAFQVEGFAQFDAFQTCVEEQGDLGDVFVGAQVTSMAAYRRSLFYQALVQPYYPYEQFIQVYTQQVQARLTVALHRMLRYSCKAEQSDQSEGVCDPAFVNNAYQSDAFQTCAGEGDPWTTQTEVTVNFADEVEQSDPWSTQDEAVDNADEEDPSPSGPGCDECR